MRIYKSIILILILLCFISGELFSQSKNNIEIQLAPTLSYRTLKKDYGFNHGVALRYDCGINYHQKITSKISLGSGIGFSRMGYNVYDYKSDSISTEKIKLNYFRNLIEIPIHFKYKLKENNNNSFELTIGLINQIYYSDEIKSDEINYEYRKSYSEIKENGWRTYNISILLGSRYNQNINDHMFLSLNPYFKYALLLFNNNIHDFCFGIKFGFGFNL
jgi:hypothetical protein